MGRALARPKIATCAEAIYGIDFSMASVFSGQAAAWVDRAVLPPPAQRLACHGAGTARRVGTCPIAFIQAEPGLETYTESSTGVSARNPKDHHAHDGTEAKLDLERRTRARRQGRRRYRCDRRARL